MDETMKIGMFIKDFAVGNRFTKTGLPVKSGAEFHAENQAQQLLSLGHEVFIMAKKRRFSTKGRETIAAVDVIRLHAPIRFLEIWLRLISTHKNTDAIYIFGVPTFAVWAILWAKIWKKPTTLVLTSITEAIEPQKNWRNKILCSCDHYIANSQQMYQGLQQLMQIPASKITLLPHGIDIKRFYPLTQVEKARVREQLKLPQEKSIVLFTSRVVLNKGVDTLQKLWRQVHQYNKDALLVVVGGGHDYLLAELTALGKELAQSIMVFGEVDDTTKWYQMADAYIFPSRFEGLPTSLMEAIASGLPCVASDIGGCQDLIQHGVNGYLVHPESPELMAQYLLDILADKQLATNLGSAGVKFAQTELDSNKLKYALEKIILKAEVD